MRKHYWVILLWGSSFFFLRFEDQRGCNRVRPIDSGVRERTGVAAADVSHPWMDQDALESLDRETLIGLVVAQAETIERLNEIVVRVAGFEAENATLRARVAELEAKLGLPPKTPDNSSTPPSQGRKASDEAASKPNGKPHAGAHRPLHPNPTARRDMMATACQHCGADVSGVAQIVCEAYDHVEIPEIKPDITLSRRPASAVWLVHSSTDPGDGYNGSGCCRGAAIDCRGEDRDRCCR